MKIKIAYPDNNIFKPLVDHDKLREYKNFELYPCPEEKCMQLMHDGRVDIALMTPLGYAQGIKKGDFRVIPGPALAYAGKSDLVSLFLKQGAQNISRVASNNPSDYLTVLANIILSERFGQAAKLERSKDSKADILKKFDAAILYEGFGEDELAFDLGEEWLFSYEIPLPIAFWVCRVEEMPQDMEQILRSISTITSSKSLDEVNAMLLMENRGSICIADWNEEVKNAVKQTVELLYYHQQVDEIAKIKDYADEA
jgi:predicted solute-binding protein